MNRAIPILHSGLLIASLSASVTLIAGCALAPRTEQGQPAPAATVEMHFHSFEPKSVSIKVGEAVLWRNTTPLVWHTVTVDSKLAEDPKDVALPDGAVPFDSGKVASGTTYEHVFSVPGTYRYFCQPHESHGMVGQVIVQ